MRKILYILCIFLPALAFSQGESFRFEPEGIPFTINGWQPFSPWTGGSYHSSPEFIDIDADGDLDLFLGVWQKINYFNNMGNNIIPTFELTSEMYDSIHFSTLSPYGYFCRPTFTDIDADSDFDMLIWTSSIYELLYINEGTCYESNFVLSTDNLLENSTNGIRKGDFADIDSDGDLDIIEGEIYGHVNIYLNYGTAFSYSFASTPISLANIDVGNCAAVSLCDIDNDDDYDLFVGNEAGQIYFYRNDGDSANYDFVYVTNNFAGALVDAWSVPTFCDIDNDGDYDLFVGMEWARYPFESGETAFYKNIGTPEEPGFIHITDNYLTFDIGASCIPQLTDVNNDGDLDLICSGSDPKIPYIENIGSASEPFFNWVEMFYGGISGGLASFNTLGDLDDDGDKDMICCTTNSMLYYLNIYENTGTPDSAHFIIQQSQFISTIADWLVPFLVDIDADGDLDLIVGTEIDQVGQILLYENIGNATTPRFQTISQTLLEYGDYYLRPFLCDYDSDGDYDMFVDIPTNLCYFENIGTAQNPNFELVTNNYAGLNLQYGTCALGDIDGDGDWDLFYGTFLEGGIRFYRNLYYDSGIENHPFNPKPSTFDLAPPYPNPFNPTTNISFTLNKALPIKLSICNQLGQTVFSLAARSSQLGTNRIVWDASGCTSGVYFVRLEGENKRQTQKVILLK